MSQFKFTIAAFGGAILLCAVPLLTAADKPIERRSAMMVDRLQGELDKEEPRINARRDAIRAELDASGRNQSAEPDWAAEWAGSYYVGDGLGMNVRIDLAPKSGIAFTNHGCLGLYGGDHGEIIEALSNGLRLRLVFGTAKGSFLSERLYFVKWDEDRFLVPDWLMPELINNYNEGGYAREGMYSIPCKERPGIDLRHRSGQTHKRKGKPELPAEFAALLGLRIELRVSRVMDTCTKKHPVGGIVHRTLVEFSSGSLDGSYVGLEATHPRGSGPKGTLRITQVTERTSTGEFTFWQEGDSPFAPTLSEGDFVVASEGEAGDAEREPDGSSP